MSDMLGNTDAAGLKEDPTKLALRGKPRPVVRFRRGLIVGVTASIAAILVTVSWFALEPSGSRKATSPIASDPFSTAAPPDALAATPKSYGDVPRLGPPLPGDLGRPILEHERSLASTNDEGVPTRDHRRFAADTERDRVASAASAARSSSLLVHLAQDGGDRLITAVSGRQAAAPVPTERTEQLAASAPAARQTVDFVGTKSGDINPDRLLSPASPFTLSAGTIIPASLITGLNSDLPGMVIAQVTENIRDTVTGGTVLVPQGARLIGRYDSVVAYGQRRALVIWSRILFPDASSIDLDNVPATDSSGYAGVHDGVDSHTWQILKGVALSTLLGVGTELSQGNTETDLIRAIRESAQQSAVNSGAQLVVKGLGIQPTIRIRPGWPVRAILTKDLVLQPWAG